METQKSTSESSSNGGKSFFQDPQKLTFAFGLSAGLAFMAIVALVIVAVHDGGFTSSKKNTNTVAADTTNTNTDTSAADATLYDPVRIASTINGIDMTKFQSCLTAGTYSSVITNDTSSGTTAGVQGTPTTFVNGTEISGALPYAQLKTAIDAALAGTKGTANVPAVSKDDHVIGATKPKVYMIEYSDFQCPYCKQFNASVQQALTAYPDTVALIYRHFPLTSIHPYAQQLAEGSECASAQGKFWQYHDTVFAQ